MSSRPSSTTSTPKTKTSRPKSATVKSKSSPGSKTTTPAKTKPAASSSARPKSATKATKAKALPTDPVARAKALRAARQSKPGASPGKTGTKSAPGSAKKGSPSKGSSMSRGPTTSRTASGRTGIDRTGGAAKRRDHLAKGKSGLDSRLKNMQGAGRVVKRSRPASDPTPPATPVKSSEAPEASALEEGQVAAAEAIATKPEGQAEENPESWKTLVGEADTWMDVLKKQEEERKAEEARLAKEAEDRRLAAIAQQEADEKARKRAERMEEQQRVFGEQRIKEEQRFAAIKQRKEKDSLEAKERLAKIKARNLERQREETSKVVEEQKAIMEQQRQERAAKKEERAARRERLNQLMAGVKGRGSDSSAPASPGVVKGSQEGESAAAVAEQLNNLQLDEEET
eukprot:TRINITY_DN7966_c0_g1_i2.p2 TRINITY_DN7966_c0_g1~~TRINITY_DN7966_c0_g1_i2.p2  ORF type:complete len:400 (+),score=91.97 TRINITY_DN7966_c0_g1_i2:2048-3247(+)